MIFDSALQFSNGQALGTATTGTTSTVIDLSGGANSAGFEPSSTYPLANNPGTTRYGADLGIGDGEAMPKVFCILTNTPAVTGTVSLNVQFQGSTDSTNWTTYVETGTITSASFPSGSAFSLAKFDWPLRRFSTDALPRYVSLNYAVTGGGNFTAGSASAWITLQREDWSAKAYPNNYTVV